MNPTTPYARLLLYGCLAGLIGAVSIEVSIQPAAGQSVWELTPYRIQVILAISPAPEFTPDFREDLAGGLLDRIDAVIGAPWDATVVRGSAELERSLIADLDGVTVEMLPEESRTSDKVFLVVVSPAPNGYQVAACDLDIHTETRSPVVRVPVWQASKLRDGVFGAVWRAFAPLARIAPDEGDLVKLRLRAGGLPVRDKGFVQVAPGDFFRPLIRYNDREGNPLRITPVPWTFLSVRHVSQMALQCKLHTGLRSPLSRRRRGRLEQFALAIVPAGGPTRLVLTSRTDPARRLAGYDVYAQSPDSVATELLGRSDRQGSLMIGPGESPLRILLIKHGGALLARLPMVPGLDEVLAASVADDNERLEAEGFVLGLQGDLIDLVTRRQVLVAMARVRLKADELDEAGVLIRQLQGLKSRDQFVRELEQEKGKIYSDDKAVQRQIDALFTDTQKLLQEYLDPRVIENLTDELSRARISREEAGS